MHLYLYNNLLSIIIIVVAGKVQEYLVCSSCCIDCVFIIIDYNNFHVIRIDVSNVETMVIVLVGEQFIFTLSFIITIVTLEHGRMDGHYVSLHVINITTPVVASFTNIKLLFTVFCQIMLLQIVLVGAPEIEIFIEKYRFKQSERL